MDSSFIHKILLNSQIYLHVILSFLQKKDQSIKTLIIQATYVIDPIVEIIALFLSYQTTGSYLTAK